MLNIFKGLLQKNRIKLICFDLDNALYDYSIAESQAEAHIAKELEKHLKKHKLNASSILSVFNQVKHSHMHHDLDPRMFSRALWIKETIERLGVNLNPKLLEYYSSQYEMKYWKLLVPKIRLFPKTLDTLRLLKDQGSFKLATITDSDGKKEIKIDRIKALGLDKYFDFIITTDDTGKNKPSIENWQYLEKISGIPPKNSLMIGDHPDVDLITPKKLGYITVWTKEHINSDIHFKYVDYEIRDIGDIIDIVKKYE